MSEPNPLPSLDELQRKIDKIKPHTGEEQRDSTHVDSQQGLALAMRMGVELVSGVAVGSIAGYYLDKWLGTMPLFFIICLFLGAAAGFRNMIRDAKKNTDTTDTK